MRTGFVGWVIQFAGWWFLHHEKGNYTLSQSLYEATVFDDRDQAARHARKLPAYILSQHGLPEVMPLWEKVQLTIVDPATESPRADN